MAALVLDVPLVVVEVFVGVEVFVLLFLPVVAVVEAVLAAVQDLTLENLMFLMTSWNVFCH